MEEEKDSYTPRTVDGPAESSEVTESPRETIKPEGGWGWVVCCGTFIVNFMVFGIHNSFGVVYANLLDELKLGKAQTAWIGAMAIGLNFLCGPITSVLCDRYTCRAVAMVGALLSVLGLFLTSFVQEPSKMYVTYGLLFGIGSSFSFVSSIVVLGEYFQKRLALVNGIATSGSGIGSLVAGPVINYLLGSIGWQNCMRILSGFAMLLWVVAFLFRSNKNQDRTTRHTHKLFDTSIWRNKAYVAWVTTVALFQFGYLIPFVHLIKYAEEIGIPKSRGAWLIGFLSITSTIGRVVFGKICDIKMINRMYVYQFSVLAIGVSTVLCPLARSYAGLIAYAVTFGFFDGCFVGQVAVITADIVGHEKLAQGVGNMFGCLGVPMSLGPPFAGWLYDGFGSYNGAFYSSGGVAIFSAFLVSIVSYMLRRRKSSTEYSGRQLLPMVNNNEETKNQNNTSSQESSGYASRNSTFECLSLLEPKEALNDSKEQYITRQIERETVL